MTKKAAKRSLIRQIIILTAILVALLVSILIVYSFASYSILRNEIERASENVLQVYGTELRNRIAQMDGILENLLIQNYSELQLIKSADEAKRFYASQDIHNYIGDVALSDSSLDFIVVADNLYGICLDASSTTTTYWDRAAIRDFTLEKAGNQGVIAEWNYIELNNKTYLYKAYIYNGRAVAGFTSAAHFLETLPKGDYSDQIFALTDDNGIIIDFMGDDWQPEVKGAQIDETDLMKGFLIEFPVVEGQLNLFSLVKNTSIWNQTRANMLVVLTVIIFTIVFGFLLIRYILQEIVSPMNSMAAGMNRIDHGEFTFRIEDQYGTREFTHLRDTFNKLMDEIVNLKIQAYEKINELKSAELKIILLQLRPHFFLNAITTIMSLSSKGKNQQIKEYVDSLSKNIRYMFKTRMHTVPIKEEIQHIENYFQMQDFKYPNCVFHYLEFPTALEDWRIPQMLIQTFVENEYKYAVSVDTPLTIFIRISTDQKDDEEMLLIEIEDDGRGYPPDVLDYMNGKNKRQVNDGSRIGLWSIKHMMELMYERKDLLYLSNIEPHGCHNKIWVPRTPVNESQEDKDDW